jgi:hypothetical protein
MSRIDILRSAVAPVVHELFNPTPVADKVESAKDRKNRLARERRAKAKLAK